MVDGDWFEVRRFPHDVTLIREPHHGEDVKVYLIEGSRDVAILDTGTGTGDFPALVASLSDRRPRVLQTHAHWDHCHNLQLFPNAEVFLHEDELAYSRAPHPEDWATPVWTADILGRCRALTPLRDGDELEPGVRVMATPGHSPGSMSVLVETPDGLAGMVGDALPSRAAARILAPRLVFFDVDVARASARRIVETCRFIYPGHDRPFRVEHGAFVSLEAQRVTVLSPPTDDDGTVQAVIDPAPSDPGPVIVPSARVPRGTA